MESHNWLESYQADRNGPPLSIHEYILHPPPVARSAPTSFSFSTPLSPSLFLSLSLYLYRTHDFRRRLKMNEARRQEQRELEEAGRLAWTKPRTQPPPSREVSPHETINPPNTGPLQKEIIAGENSRRANRFTREESIATGQQWYRSREASTELHRTSPTRSASRTSPLDLTRTTKRAHRPSEVNRSGTDSQHSDGPSNKRLRSPLADILSPPPHPLTRTASNWTTKSLSPPRHLLTEGALRRGSNVCDSSAHVPARASPTREAQCSPPTTQWSHASNGPFVDGIPPKRTARTFSEATTTFESSTQDTLSVADRGSSGEQYVGDSLKRHDTHQAHEPEDRPESSLGKRSEDSTSVTSSAKSTVQPRPSRKNEVRQYRRRTTPARVTRQSLKSTSLSSISQSQRAERHGRLRRTIGTESGESCPTKRAERLTCSFCTRRLSIRKPSPAQQTRHSSSFRGGLGRRLNGTDRLCILVLAICGLGCTSFFLFHMVPVLAAGNIGLSQVRTIHPNCLSALPRELL